MFAGLEGLPSQVEMSRDRSDDGDGVDGIVVQEIMIIGRGTDRGIPTLHLGETIRLQIAHRCDFGATRFREIADQVRPPVAIADQPNTDHRLPPLLLVSSPWSIVRGKSRMLPATDYWLLTAGFLASQPLFRNAVSNVSDHPGRRPDD